MSTRSAIICETENGFLGIYCHSDGYPSGVGNTLNEHYKDLNKVLKLIDLGDISSLGERVEPIGDHSYDKKERGTTVAYHRDRGEDFEDVKPISGDTPKEVADKIDHSYCYLFRDGYWSFHEEI